MTPTLPRYAPMDRRRLPDRRTGPTTLLSALRARDQRPWFRRAGEGHQASGDGRARRTVGLALFVCVASLLDARLTLDHLARGGEEANPVLALALTHGTALFLPLKIALTGAGVWILTAHHQVPLAARGLQGLALGYGAVLVYHLVLCWRLV
jgi:hypothetical protein